MTIKKYAHACLLVDIDGTKIIIDPGSWNELPDATGVSALLITHEHQDHFDLDQVRQLAATNPDMVVISHPAVIEKMQDDSITAMTIEPGKPLEVSGVAIESFGTEHAVVYGASPCRNTGFLINNELFVPGDAVHDVPDKSVRILALPTGGPWMKIAEAIDYAKAVHPAVAFPIHDAMYVDMYQRMLVPGVVGNQLREAGIEFVDMPAGTSQVF